MQYCSINRFWRLLARALGVRERPLRQTPSRIIMQVIQTSAALLTFPKKGGKYVFI